MAIFANTNPVSNNQHDSGSGSGVLKTGANLRRLGEFGRIRQSLMEAMMIDADNCTQENVDKFAKKSGEIDASNVVYAAESKQRLNVARGLLKRYQIGMQHLQGATQIEQQWQQTTAQGMERLEPMLMEIGVTQARREGTVIHLDRASEILSY